MDKFPFCLMGFVLVAGLMPYAAWAAGPGAADAGEPGVASVAGVFTRGAGEGPSGNSAQRLEAESASASELRAAVGSYIAAIEEEATADSRYPEAGALDIQDIPAAFPGTQPRLGWVRLQGGAVAQYEFYFDDVRIMKTGKDEVAEPYDPERLVDVKGFGAVGDGKADDTEAIRKAVARLNEDGGILYFPTGTYAVSIAENKESVMSLKSGKDVEVDFMQSTLKLQPTEHSYYDMVRVEGCTNAVVRNGTLVGDRKTHLGYGVAVPTDPKGTHQWGMGASALDNARCSIANMDISDTTGDAVYARSAVDGTLGICGCHLHHCRRQGISVTGADVVNVTDTIIECIGTFDDIEGVLPMCGIDVEPYEAGCTINRVALDNVTARNVTKYGLVRGPGDPDDVKEIAIANSSIENLFVKRGAAVTDSELVNPVVIEVSAIEGSRIRCEAGDLFMTDCTVDGCLFEGRDLAGTADEAGSRIYPANVTATDTTFKNIQGKGDYGADQGCYGLQLRGDWGFANGSARNVYDGCGIVMGDFAERDASFNGCFIYKPGGVELAVGGAAFDGCSLRLGSGPLRLNGCTVKDCAILDVPGTREELCLVDSEMAFDSIPSPDCLPGSITCDSSTLRVAGSVADDAFRNVRLLNGGTIALDAYEAAEAKEPTCTQRGSFTWAGMQGALSVTSSTAPLGHVLEEVAEVPATCENPGSQGHWKCARCSELFADADGATGIERPVPIPALGHSWEPWSLVSAADYGKAGAEKRVCARCGREERRVIAARERTSLAGAAVSGVVAREYDGKAQVQSATLTVDGATLSMGRDYTVSYRGNVRPGTATVTFKGAGAYTGSVSVPFKIAKAKASKFAVAKVKRRMCTGKRIKPQPKVSFAGRKLVRGRDYALGYRNNVKPGKARIVITGKGNFTGRKIVAFTIARRHRAAARG